VPGRTRTLGKAASVGGQRCPGKTYCVLLILALVNGDC
jgi:hypothetical protein